MEMHTEIIIDSDSIVKILHLLKNKTLQLKRKDEEFTFQYPFPSRDKVSQEHESHGHNADSLCPRSL